MLNQPDAIFIGFQKAGSTFLRSYFTYHPDIYWARNGRLFMEDFDKEHYLSLDNMRSEHKCYIDMYESLAMGFLRTSWEQDMQIRFIPDFRLASDGHDLPTIDMIPLRIKDALPKAKILIVIRNQLDWLRSHYMYYLGVLPEKRKKFRDYISMLDGKRVLFAGSFHHTIEVYFGIFGKHNVHVMILEQIRDEMEESLKKLCEFLDVDFVNFPQEEWRINRGRSYGIGHIIRISTSLGISYASLQKLSLSSKYIKRIIPKLYNYDVLTSSEKYFIHAFYAGSNYYTSKLIGIDLGQYGYPI
jgi:hypothetical protein